MPLGRTSEPEVFKSGQESIFVRLLEGAGMPAGVKNVDRRVQKTQDLLRNALVSLLAQKPYDAIVVKEILDRANVGRSTFYMHFRDKDDLLVSGIHEMLGPIPSSTRMPNEKGP